MQVRLSFVTQNDTATLKEKGRMTKILTKEVSSEPLANYVRVHRRRAGLSQRELGRVLGYHDDGTVARHEQFRSLPPLLIALGYEVVFQISTSEMFSGLKQTVALVIERRIADLENELRKKSGTGTRAALVAKKLEWLSQRRKLTT